MPGRTSSKVCHFFKIQLSFVLIISVFSSIEESPVLIAERPVTAPVSIPTLENIDRIQRPSTGSSVSSSIRTPRSSNQTKKLPKINESNDIHREIKQEPWIHADSDDRGLIQKESSFEKRSYNHDVLVIQTQPPKVNNYKKQNLKKHFILFIL